MEAHAIAMIEKQPRTRDDLNRLAGDIASLERIFETWDVDHKSAAEAYKRALEALHGEALRRLIRALKSNPAAYAAMKQAVGDEVVYAVLRRHGLLKPSLDERLNDALEAVRPMLATHGGDVAIVKIEPPRVEVKFSGTCDGCAASALTFQAGVKKAIQDACPEITEVVQVKGLAPGAKNTSYQSPFASKDTQEWIPVGALNDIPDGQVRHLEAGDRRVFLFRNARDVTCFDDECAHMGSPIASGSVANGILTCPRHRFRYDLRTGECVTTPGLRLVTHLVRVVGDDILVSISR
jgi:nitrite reductase/ring-hydroxylating ferredoxin subunit/Fe-S cluster biogenesis protein NfuA